MEEEATRVLVIDDDLDTRVLLARRLQKAGYEVETRANGEEALHDLGTISPDVILADWMMPLMTGPELCRRLRSTTAYRDVPFVLLTARSLENDVVEGFEAGANDYIVKPFTIGELSARIESLAKRPSSAR